MQVVTVAQAELAELAAQAASVVSLLSAWHTVMVEWWRRRRGGSNLGLAGRAEGGSACQGEINATTPACLTVLVATLTAATQPPAAGGIGIGGIGGDGGLAFGGDGGLGGVACFKPGSSFNTNAGTSSIAGAEIKAEGGNGGHGGDAGISVSGDGGNQQVLELAEVNLVALLVAVVAKVVSTH